MRSARASHARKAYSVSPQSLSVFSLVPDLLFDCSRLLEYAKIRTVLQSINAMNLLQKGQYLWNIILLWKKYLSFAGARSQMNTDNALPKSTRRNVKLNKFVFGTT